MNKVKVLVFTAEPSNFVPINLKKAAEELGFTTEIIDATKLMIEEAVSKQEDEEGPVTLSRICEVNEETGAILEVVVDKNTVIIPRLNEYHLDIKLGMLKRMQDMGATLINTLEGMALCNDKLLSQVALSTAKIRTPSSWIFQDPDLFEKVVDTKIESGDLKFPIIVKTLRGTHGIGVMKLDSRASLVSVAQLLIKEELDFMVQEFIEHEQSARIIMKGTEILAANLRGQPKNKGEFRTNSHLGSETEPYTPSKEETELAVKIVELFGTNFCAIDYIIIADKDGGKELVVLEVNGSPGLENIQKNWPDKNLAKEVVEFAATKVAPEQDPTIPVSDETPAAEPEELPVEPAETEFLNHIESVVIHRINDNEPMTARIDTGAKYSSIHADNVRADADWVKFSIGDVTYKVPYARDIKIKNVHGGDSSVRQIIKLDVTIAGKRFNGIEFTLSNRGVMKYPVLIGRNVIEQLGLPVKIVPEDPDAKFDLADETVIYQIEEE